MKKKLRKSDDKLHKINKSVYAQRDLSCRWTKLSNRFNAFNLLILHHNTYQFHKLVFTDDLTSACKQTCEN